MPITGNTKGGGQIYNCSKVSRTVFRIFSHVTDLDKSQSEYFLRNSEKKLSETFFEIDINSCKSPGCCLCTGMVTCSIVP